MKDSFPKPIDSEKLMRFFQSRIGEKTLPIIMRNFDIPESEPQNKELLSRALCIQFQNIVSEVSDEVDNIVASEYIRFLRASDNGAASNAPYYFGDEYRVICQSPEHKRTLNFYQDFEHQWTVKNTGTVTWENRYLECTNQSEIRIKARSNNIKIPKVKPGDEILLNIEFNSRGIEGKYEALWEMKDSDGNSCFPDKNESLRVEAVVTNICENAREE
jgi:ASC-1-like (ASCH) protein